VFLCMPKCASTSTQQLLQRFGQITTGNDPGFKHLNYHAYEKFFKPLLIREQKRRRARIDNLEVVCLFREPVDWVSSWYRYRARAELKDSPEGKTKSTAGLNFEEFAREYVSPTPRAFATIGRQINFVKNESGQVGSIKFFRYEEYDSFIAYMSEKVGEKLVAPRLNVSQVAKGPETEKLAFLVEYLREEYELYEKI
jgi:hypothetical protein